MESFAFGSCRLTAPPISSAVDENDGEFYFAYPRTVGAQYSGCQLVWADKGKRVFSYRFSRGHLVEYRASAMAASESELVCRYTSDVLNAGAPKSCPAYADVRGGTLTLPRDEEPDVPPGRDARSKSK